MLWNDLSDSKALTKTLWSNGEACHFKNQSGMEKNIFCYCLCLYLVSVIPRTGTEPRLPKSAASKYSPINDTDSLCVIAIT